MKIFKFAAYAAMAISMLMLASCREKEGPEVIIPIDVFFSAENGDYCYYAAPGTATDVVLKLVRTDVEKDAIINIKVNDATSGITIPESVKFAVGEAETTITISTPANGAALDKYDFDISLSGDYVNPSATSDLGTIRCEGTVYIYEEYDALTSFGYDGDSEFAYLGYMSQKVWKLADSKFILKDFLGGGEDLSFKHDDEFTSYGYNISSVDYGNGDYKYVYEDADYPGSQYIYFWKDDGTDNGEYKNFYPKGKQRYIPSLAIYIGDNYSNYYVSDKYDYISLCASSVEFYSESEDIDKSKSWIYLTIDLKSDAKKYDTTSFPEISTSTYPEPKTDVTVPDGSVKMRLYFKEENVYSDSQAAAVTATESGKDYTIANFLGTTNTLVIHTANGTYTTTVLDQNGKEISSDYSGYRYFGMDIYPWAADTSWRLASVCYYNTTGYCGWIEDEKYGYCYLYYDLYHGESYTQSEGYVYFMWE